MKNMGRDIHYALGPRMLTPPRKVVAYLSQGCNRIKLLMNSFTWSWKPPKFHAALELPRFYTELVFPSTTHISLQIGEAITPTYILTVRSRPPLTTLSATKSTQYTSSVCPGRSLLSLYVLRSQILSSGQNQTVMNAKRVPC